jgi:hypothetical protein
VPKHFGEGAVPIIGYFGVMTPLLLFALLVASALLDPRTQQDEPGQMSSVSAVRDPEPEIFDRLKALRIDKP